MIGGGLRVREPEDRLTVVKAPEKLGEKSRKALHKRMWQRERGQLKGPPIILLANGEPGAGPRGPQAREILETETAFLLTDHSAYRRHGEGLVADAPAQEHSTQSHLLGDTHALGEAPPTSPVSGRKIRVKRWLKEMLSRRTDKGQEVDANDAEARHKGATLESAKGSSSKEPYPSMIDVAIVGKDVPGTQRRLDKSGYSPDEAVLGSQRCSMPVSPVPNNDESMGRLGPCEYTVSRKDGYGGTSNDEVAPPLV